MESIMILVKGKTVYVHLGEILKSGELFITNTLGNRVFQEEITNSHYKVIKLDQPQGRYQLVIDSEKLKTKKSFHLK